MLLTLASTLIFGSFNPLVVYGVDDRVEMKDVQSAAIRELGRSTLAIIWSDSLSYNHDTEHYELKSENQITGLGVCPEEPFALQPYFSGCTGILISPDKVLTAGHCFLEMTDQNEKCRGAHFVIDYAMSSEGQIPKTFSRDQVFHCQKVLQVVYTTASEDFSIIQLDRPIHDRRPIAPSQGPLPVPGTPIFSMGYPDGLPLKFIAGATVRSHKTNAFVTDLDTYHGNSGSPVFNATTLELEGVLVRGEADFDTIESRHCLRSRHLPQKEGRGEDVSTLPPFKSFQ